MNRPASDGAPRVRRGGQQVRKALAGGGQGARTDLTSVQCTEVKGPARGNSRAYLLSKIEKVSPKLACTPARLPGRPGTRSTIARPAGKSPEISTEVDPDLRPDRRQKRPADQRQRGWAAGRENGALAAVRGALGNGERPGHPLPTDHDTTADKLTVTPDAFSPRGLRRGHVKRMPGAAYDERSVAPFVIRAKHPTSKRERPRRL